MQLLQQLGKSRLLYVNGSSDIHQVPVPSDRVRTPVVPSKCKYNTTLNGITAKDSFQLGPRPMGGRVSDDLC